MGTLHLVPEEATIDNAESLQTFLSSLSPVNAGTLLAEIQSSSDQIIKGSAFAAQLQEQQGGDMPRTISVSPTSAPAPAPASEQPQDDTEEKAAAGDGAAAASGVTPPRPPRTTNADEAHQAVVRGGGRENPMNSRDNRQEQETSKKTTCWTWKMSACAVLGAVAAGAVITYVILSGSEDNPIPVIGWDASSGVTSTDEGPIPVEYNVTTEHLPGGLLPAGTQITLGGSFIGAASTAVESMWGGWDSIPGITSELDLASGNTVLTVGEDGVNAQQLFGALTADLHNGVIPGLTVNAGIVRITQPDGTEMELRGEPTTLVEANDAPTEDTGVSDAAAALALDSTAVTTTSLLQQPDGSPIGLSDVDASDKNLLAAEVRITDDGIGTTSLPTANDLSEVGLVWIDADGIVLRFKYESATMV